MPPIRALFLDMDNTLTDDSGSIRQSLLQVMPLISRRYPELTDENVYATFRRINNWHWENYDESPIAALQSSIDVRAYIAEETLEALGHSDRELARELAVAFQEARRKTYTCYEDTIPVLNALRGQVKLALITNGNTEMQREKIVRCQLEPLMDAIFIAQEAGVSKPSPLLFQMALEAVETAPDETLMVGDNPAKDIVGAQSAGLVTAWIRRNGREADAPGLRPDYVVRTMHEVREIVNRHGR